MYLLIALLHGVPICLAAAVTRSKIATGVTCAIMIIIGILTGSPTYAALDILAVAGAMWLCFRTLPPSVNATLEAPNKFVSVVLGVALTLVATIVLFVSLSAVIIVYNRFFGECADSELSLMNVTFEQCRAAHPRKH